MPGYGHTPLVEVERLAQEMDVSRVFVKDESARLGLPAFKMLGASWAASRAVSSLVAADEVPRTLDAVRKLRTRLGAVTLVTATDGNHGRAVARMARLLDAEAQIFVPHTVEASAVALIESEGAVVEVVEASYDATVRVAAESSADRPDALLVQDTAWPGYEEVPQWIVEGYSTLFREIDAQLAQQQAPPPDLVVVPVGVGSLAQAAVAHYRSADGKPAALLSVEPCSAACVLTSLHEGQRVSVGTGQTSMAGLNCGTPSSIAWPFLLNGMDAATCVSDDDADLAAGSLSGAGIGSGPCGAASLAAVRQVLRGPDGGERREQLGLAPTSTVVLLSTEGPRNG